MLQYLNPDEVVKRLAAAQGIDVLNLVKSMDQRQQEQQQSMEQQQQMEMTKQAAAMQSAPINDPSKNPALAQQLSKSKLRHNNHLLNNGRSIFI